VTPSLRTLALTAHVSSSVGWLGAVATFLALAVAGVASQDAQIVRASYLTMHTVTWFVIVPFCLASLATGITQSLGTAWGLLRHYWVVTKLLLTGIATIILLVHTQPIGHVAAFAAQSTLSSGDLRDVRLRLVGDAAAALFVLFTTTTLSIYKPWGLTPYGLRKSFETASPSRGQITRRSASAGRYVLWAIAGFLLVIVILHLFGVDLGGHRRFGP
jgi:hypothetical protein